MNHKCDSMWCPSCGHRNRIAHLLRQVDSVTRMLEQQLEFRTLVAGVGCYVPCLDDLYALIEELGKEIRREGDPSREARFERWKEIYQRRFPRSCSR